MLIDPIVAFAGGFTTAWSRAFLGLAAMSGSTFLAATFQGHPEPGIFLWFPVYLIVGCNGWGYLLPVAWLMLLFVLLLFIWCIRFDVSARSLLFFLLIPFLIYSAPEWFSLFSFATLVTGPRGDWGWTVFSLVLFLVATWYFRRVLFKASKENLFDSSA